METSSPVQSVFIVHSYDVPFQTEVAHVVESLGLKAIILNEPTSPGDPLIEKMERHSSSNVVFAIVLLTPDDKMPSYLPVQIGGFGRSLTDVLGSEAGNARARQYVILQWGYLLGKLGFDRVAALHKEGMELPSGMRGVPCTRHDAAGAWRQELVRQMQAAGLDVDPSQLQG